MIGDSSLRASADQAVLYVLHHLGHLIGYRLRSHAFETAFSLRGHALMGACTRMQTSFFTTDVQNASE